MVKITNGKNVMIVPQTSYDEFFSVSGWSILKKKKKQVDETTEENVEQNTTVEEKKNKPNKR